MFDNRDYSWADELTIKTVFLTVLFNESLMLHTFIPTLTKRCLERKKKR